MKRTILFMVVAVLFLATACNSKPSGSVGQASQQQADAKFYYTCTMHPEIHSDKPGKCPKCGMELVKKEVTEADTAMQMSSDSMQKMKGM